MMDHMVQCPACFCYRRQVGIADEGECPKCKKKDNEISDIVTTKQLFNMRNIALSAGNIGEFNRITKCLAMRGE